MSEHGRRAEGAAGREVLGFFGGTFDPVHNGHLRMALELKQQLGFGRLSLVPCHKPPHRQTPDVLSSDRLAMVKLALKHCPQLSIDARELERNTPSYTVETMESLRLEHGPLASLSWCVGMDSLATFDRWHRWRDLLSLGHLVVVRRPGWQVPVEGELGEWLQSHLQTDHENIRHIACGGVFLFDSPMLEISATVVREEIAAGRSAQFLVPDTVWHYICEKQLYTRV